MYSMNYIGKFISNFRDFYNEINAATLTGAIDVVVVQQPDGSFTCSPFHVRFGKLGVLRSREKVVDIEINSEPREIHMKLGDSGEAFFVEEVPGSNGFTSDADIPPHLACSPIPNDDDVFPNRSRFQVLSDLPPEQHEKILRDSVMSIEREKWEQMSALPPDQREKFLKEHFSDLPIEERDKWLQIASLTSEERDKIFNEYYESISTIQKQRMISEQYSALKTEDKDRLFKENFPELPKDQRQSFEKALLTEWKQDDVTFSPKRKQHNREEIGEEDEEEIEEEEDDDDDERDKSLRFNEDEEIFDMEVVSHDDKPRTPITNPKSFVAVTSTEKIRKISEVKNDFRPIESPRQYENRDHIAEDSAHAPLSSSSSSSSTKKSLKGESTVDDVKIGTVAKRKRKRKSVMKRKGAQRKISANNSANEGSIDDALQCKMKEADAVIDVEQPSLDNSDSVCASDAIKDSCETGQLLKATHPVMDFHFFSDTEITAKNKDSRPSSPVQSDTEFEVQKITQENKAAEDHESHGQSWRWGELPSPPHDASRDPSMNPVDATISSNEKKASGGDEEDAESGNGPSLPQSPNSVEGAIGGPKSLDSDFDESSKHFEPGTLDVRLSLCGLQQAANDEAFQRQLLRYEDALNDPKLFDNPNLVLRINGKPYSWASGCAHIVVFAAFQRHLPQGIMPSLSRGEQLNSSAGETSNKGYSSWFSWRRSSQPPAKKSPNSSFSDPKQDDNGTAAALVEVVYNEPLNLSKADASSDSNQTTIVISDAASSANDERNDSEINDSFDSLGTSQSMVSFNDAVDKSESTVMNLSKETEGYAGGNEDSDEERPKEIVIDVPSHDSNSLSTASAATPMPKRSYHEGSPNYRKTLRLSSQQIASLNLKEGVNEVVFSVTTAYQGTTRCKCFIYKWRWDDKIVISDIDGTITKSDVLGHILPIVGKDWAQSGVAQLFTKIKDNGYKLLYLSARAIGQARVTREYLKSIKQGDLSLPDGPLLLNPTSLISAFHREVIEKKPEEFKISCLSDIKALFPEGSQPFYAGYGNRINDVWAYRAVGIPTTRIFTINHRGELKHELTQTFQSSYSNMSYIVDHLFPALREDAAEEFSNFSYWREPIQDLMKFETLAVQH